MTKKYIEDAWKSYRKLVMPADASVVQIAETRQAFFAGAAILFEALMLGLDADQEPTDADMQRMEDLQTEITAFGQQLDLKLLGITRH